ncbi:hypothetical protein DRP53_02980 [candidate division WOR-3 bacterium]|uniref:Permease n=1 Tax=candidate division WOR-3 bacterium TaxID=2052148 RepID=A0A660SJQ7_UNCW3|nr:MAG: hypothetical protein DRP53_02980 [candidate division WOR-3 bacterium]
MRRLYFLIAVALLYFILYLTGNRLAILGFEFSLRILARIGGVFILVFLFMFFVNYLVTPKVINRYLARSAGIKRWLFAILGGIISTGPLYLWLPMLKGIKEQGVSDGFIAAFLYNRAIKPALLPLLILYFGLKYTILLTGTMIFFSIMIGLIMENVKFTKSKT